MYVGAYARNVASDGTKRIVTGDAGRSDKAGDETDIALAHVAGPWPRAPRGGGIFPNDDHIKREP